jgi:dipeptidyl aminopeptidase/acylaminoacyl peptidase
LERLTQPDLAGAPADGFVPYRTVAFPSFDGRSIPGFLLTPRGSPPAAGWPVVVWVHGGPEAQTRATFRPDMQMLVDQGYLVLMPNVRGSTGYGRSYGALDDVERRMDSVRDLAHAHAWLAARSDVDRARIGIMGQSYGGFMVLSAITTFPRLWASAIDYYGVANFVTLLATTGPWRRRHRAAEYGDPDRDAALLARISPIADIARTGCPLLVLHGHRDPRVPIGESEQVVAALERLGKPVEYRTFPYQGHGFTRPDDRRSVYAAVADFFARTL